MNQIIDIIINVLIDYVHLLGKILIGTTIGSVIGGKIQLHRLSPYNGKTIASKNFVLGKVDSLEQEAIDYEKKEVLKPYILTLSNYVEAEDLKIISNNLKTVDIKRQPLLFLLFVGGMYNSQNNHLLFASNSSFGHEFLRLASSIYDRETGISLSGFEQQKKNAYIGRGLSRGYTELLASRLYHKKNEVEAYMNLVKFAQMIEFFFDNPKEMSHLYFTCNLPGLIKQLEEYASNKEVMQLIKDMDFAYVNGRYYSPFALLKSVQIQMKLYQWFQAKCKDEEKLSKFEKLACKNKVVSLLIKGKKLKLNRKSFIEVPKQVEVQSKSGEVSSALEKKEEKEIVLEKQPKISSFLDVLSEEEREALEEMLQVENITSSSLERQDPKLQKSILEDMKATLLEDNNQANMSPGKQL